MAKVGKSKTNSKKKEEEISGAAAIIRRLRESTGENRIQFAEHVGIPVRTIDDWENGRRVPPDYIPRMIAYQLELEKLKAEMLEAKQAEAMKEAEAASDETTNESDDEQA